jgi:predicted nucleic acid-binding protein
MSFVIDASIAACWALRDEQHPHADAARERIANDPGLAPSLWWFEIRNILVIKERTNRITEADSTTFLSWMTRLGIELDRSADSSELLRLARKHKLTAYDAAYLELAMRIRVPLATLDRNLSTAAKAEGVPVIGATAAPESQS